MDEDMILPDDFQMDQPQSEEVAEPTEPQDLQTESVEDTKPTEEVEQPVEQPQMVKLKYNHQEEEVPLDEAIKLAQMGKNYPKLQEKLQEMERFREFIQELGQEHGYDPIQYMDAVREQREQQMLDRLIQENIPEEYAREMLENRKFRQQYNEEQQKKVDEERKNKEYMEFFDYFRDANGRDFVPSQDILPENVLANKDMPLKFAYMMHENQQLRQQIQTLKQNETNASKAPVSSTTAHGSTETASEDPFLAGFNSI